MEIDCGRSTEKLREHRVIALRAKWSRETGPCQAPCRMYSRLYAEVGLVRIAGKEPWLSHPVAEIGGQCTRGED